MPERPEPLLLTVDPERVAYHGSTGIYVRAQLEDHVSSRVVNADIAELTYESLMSWLRSRGGDNPWAESVVASLLGHDPA